MKRALHSKPGGRLLAPVLAGALLCLPLAAQGPQNVVVVVNRRSPASLDIANYYVRARHVPSKNVCRITTTDAEEISRSVFETEIARPVAECLKSRGLMERALYLVTTLGVPLKISGAAGMDGDEASVDSELTLLYGIIRRNARPPVRGYVPNPFYRERNVRFAHPRFPLYLVTRLAAYDVAEAKRLVDRSLAARNTGKVVLDLKSSDFDNDGNAWLRMTAPLVARQDRVVLDETTRVLTGEKRVIAYASWGSNDSHRKSRFTGFEFLPGAIAIQYVSTDGRTFRRPPGSWNITTWGNHGGYFRGSPQSLTADLVHEGVTGASGHVYEPYLQMCPRPDYVIPAYLRGWNLAESFYSGMRALSWQNIVVGDPLCTLAPAR